MVERVSQEVELLRRAYERVELDPDHGWVIIGDVPLEPGWNRSRTDVLLKFPPGFPTTPPDNFWTEAGLCLADGGEPGNSSSDGEIAGRSWRLFSFHLVDPGEWRPHQDIEKGHNLLTYLSGVQQRLREAS